MQNFAKLIQCQSIYAPECACFCWKAETDKPSQMISLLSLRKSLEEFRLYNSVDHNAVK